MTLSTGASPVPGRIIPWIEPVLAGVQRNKTRTSGGVEMKSFSPLPRTLGCIVFCLVLSASAFFHGSIAKAAQPPAGSDAKLISDFEDGTPNAKFGTGWMLSTDSIAGGKSTGEMKVVDGGANAGKHALRIAGLIDGGLPYAWTGVMWSPGSQPFAADNLSTRKSIVFFSKGDGHTYRVLVFTVSGGQIPAQQTFTAGAEWKKTSIPFSAFNGTDGHDVMAILFVGGPAPGKFDFQVDDVSLE